MKRPVLIVGLVALALTVGAILLLLSDAQREPLQVGDAAPNFRLDGAFGGVGEISDMRGRVVILNFWATWCAPCIAEMPSLQTLYRKFEDDDFEIVAVSLDKEGAPVVKQFAERHRLTFAMVVDPRGTTEESYRLMGVPETYVIDKDGIIIERVLGPRDWNDDATIRKFADLLGREPRTKLSAEPTTATTFTVPPPMDSSRQNKTGGKRK